MRDISIEARLDFESSVDNNLRHAVGYQMTISIQSRFQHLLTAVRTSGPVARIFAFCFFWFFAFAFKQGAGAVI
jgi:hypothetical protein